MWAAEARPGFAVKLDFTPPILFPSVGYKFPNAAKSDQILDFPDFQAYLAMPNEPFKSAA